MDEAGTLLTRWMQLNNERTSKLEEEVFFLKKKVDEYKIPFDVMELFILEKGLNEELLIFLDELFQDFHKNKKPNLTLVQ